MRANLWEDAIPAFGLVIRILPDLAQGYHGRGVAYYNESKEKDNDNLFEPALEDLDKALELKPDFAEAYKDRALLHRDLGDTENALSDLDKAIEIGPFFAEAYKDRALLHRDLGDTEKAISDMEKAVSFYDPLRQSDQLAEARNLVDELRR